MPVISISVVGRTAHLLELEESAFRPPSDLERAEERYLARRGQSSLSRTGERREKGYFDYPGPPATAALMVEYNEYLALAIVCGHFDRLRNAVKEGSADEAALQSIRFLEKLFGFRAAVEALQPAAEKHFNGALRFCKDDRAAQDIWAARWMTRYRNTEDLRALCEGIVTGKRPAPIGFEASFFAALVAPEDDPRTGGKRKGLSGRLELTYRFATMTKGKIKELANTPLFPASELPPLSIDEFPAPIKGRAQPNKK